MQAGMHTGREAMRQAGMHTGRQGGRQRGRHVGRHVGRLTGCMDVGRQSCLRVPV